MSYNRFISLSMPKIANVFLLIVPLLLGNLAFNILTIIGFLFSALGENWKTSPSGKWSATRLVSLLV